MNSNFTDKDILNDSLISQKAITSNYNTYANECANNTTRTTLLNILNDEHNIEYEIFEEMQKRGWYEVQSADSNKVTQAKTKFQNMISS